MNRFSSNMKRAQHPEHQTYKEVNYEHTHALNNFTANDFPNATNLLMS